MKAENYLISMVFCKSKLYYISSESYRDILGRLQSRELAAGWNQMFSAIRDANSLPGNIRELLVRPIMHASPITSLIDSVDSANSCTQRCYLSMVCSSRVSAPTFCAE